MRTQKARFLVKSDGAEIHPDQKLGIAGNTFALNATWKLGGEGGEWSAYELGATASIAELWDAAHEQAARGVVIEPDCENLILLPATKAQRGLFAGGSDADRGVENPQSDKFEKGPGFAWHLDDEYSELRRARESVQNPQTVRAAILDVGFDFEHEAMPRNLRTDLQRNFTGDGRPGAADPDKGGFLKNPGHGTATISLLAGGEVKRLAENGILQGPLGGAPDIEVVPLRIADSVVMLKTSAFAEAIEYLLSLRGDPDKAVDVVSMSMGGVASRLWADAVNRAYEAGIVLVTAAGNNFGRPKSIIFPARFRRVLAVCGAMANFEPYVLPFGTMSGNYGPGDKMLTALSAFTPNISWAEIGSKDIVDSDGEGTSSATPQVAAAAALWLQQHKAGVARWAGWQKVEMARKALFDSADRNFAHFEDKYFGRGLLKAHAALAIRPTEAIRKRLAEEDKDTAAFAFFRALRGTIFAAADLESDTDESFNLELTQLMHRDPRLEELLPDLSVLPSTAPEARTAAGKFVDAVVESGFASDALKKALREKSGRPGGDGTGGKGRALKPAGTEALADRLKERAPTPSCRRLRVFAFDPSAGGSLEGAAVRETTIAVPWESLRPGPSGEYVEVVDHDPASGCFYPPVDLEDLRLVASDGYAPEEGNPKFHQQMVYGVAMRTIETFERSLGRKVLWSPLLDGKREAEYVPRLRIYPHALRDRNAYYNPLKKAVLFGYFPAQPVTLDAVHPGGTVFTCLSHDVVAHEMTHAILDGVARDLVNPTNPDMLAFHEAFADLVAMFQHFSLPGVLERELAKTRGNLRAGSHLVELARQFGAGIGLHGALRSYMGSKPDPTEYGRSEEPHRRGAVLVAAVFDAFVSIYESRIGDLKRIASEGTGILREGDLHPDLIRRFAEEAAKAANHLLRMCIRALDYCPPLDLTFGDYLRALITLDAELFPDDPYFYRVALIQAFRARGIYPHDVRTLSEDSLKWRKPTSPTLSMLNNNGIMRRLLGRLGAVGDIVRRTANSKGYLQWPIRDMDSLRHWDLPGQEDILERALKTRERGIVPGREAVYCLLKMERAQTHEMLQAALDEEKPADRDYALEEAGLYAPPGKDYSFEVHALNFADREEASGGIRRDFMLWLKRRDETARFEGGATVVGNSDTGFIRYIVRKSYASSRRRNAELEFHARGYGRGNTYYAHTPFAGPGSRFAMIHGAEESEEESYA